MFLYLELIVLSGICPSCRLLSRSRLGTIFAVVQHVELGYNTLSSAWHEQGASSSADPREHNCHSCVQKAGLLQVYGRVVYGRLVHRADVRRNGAAEYEQELGKSDIAVCVQCICLKVRPLNHCQDHCKRIQLKGVLILACGMSIQQSLAAQSAHIPL